MTQPEEHWVRISDAADIVGVSPSTLRRWESLGLIAPARTDGSYRRYSAADLDLLRKIRHLQASGGLNVAAIKAMLAPSGGRASSFRAPVVTVVARPTPQVKSANQADVSRGGALRDLRQKQGLSLRAAARRAGVSASFLSALERGLSGVSMATLKRLTATYGTTVAQLLRDSTFHAGRVMRAAEMDRAAVGAGLGVKIIDLAPQAVHLEPQLFVLAPGSTSDGMYTHAGEEFIHVLAGKLSLSLEDGESYVLAAGDSVSFPSTISHGWRNDADEETRLLWINTPPTF
jgi:DNA-binding transcriptional MerR regulator/quercetin dioxygenase-like cupin family protein